MITELKPNEVFVFGSNSTGFHGAGSAGLACRGESKNTWRTDKWFLTAMNSPSGSDARVGKWAVYGHAKGLQVGKEGMSYAIKTIERPGKKRSTSLQEIKTQLLELARFAQSRPELTFIMTPIGAGLAGWTEAEMLGIWNEVVYTMPSNVVYPENLYNNVNPLNT